jgi:hypothetical protein
MSHDFVVSDEPSRRDLIAGAARALLGVSVLPLFERELAAADSGKAKHLIYLFMNGAISQLDTFDPKPGRDVQGETKAISTKIPGVRFGEHFRQLADWSHELAVVRSLTTETGAHGPGQYLMRTNYKQIATSRHPGLGVWLHRLAGRLPTRLPPTVQVGGGEGPGFLSAKYAPVPIGDPSKGLQNTKSPSYLSDTQFDRRMRLAVGFDRAFRGRGNANQQVTGYDDLYREAISLLRSKDLEAFDITKEPTNVREQYGETRFGKGCLLARRLIENGVRSFEVTFKSWDHHNNIFDSLPDKAQELDRVVGALLADLSASGLLDKTLLVIGTEFGRKPQINQNTGRDHHPAAFSCALAGGGIQGGQVYGSTDEDAFHVEDGMVTVQDFNATIVTALGLRPDEDIEAPGGRPFTLGNGGSPIQALLS